MKCELCGNHIGHLMGWVPVFQYQDSPFEQEVWAYKRGIHLDCIKEMLDVLRSATLAMAPRHENEAPTGENDGN